MKTYPKIWFMRHGETEWNAEGRVQGQTESVLSARGVEHAKQQYRLMAPILETNPPCIVSPLRRTRQTADIALGGRKYEVDDRLKEVFAGEWEGQLRTDIFNNLPEGITPATPHMEFYAAAPGGEGFDAFQARVRDFVSTLNEPTVIVAHGLSGQLLRGELCGLTRSDLGKLTNRQGCVYVIEDGVETVLELDG
ncbi:MAG: histidine phosphatase family protein [Sulfitobacter sp.]|jgi:broad specificity phosphatase PhoE|uniref:histidine phosphatase family protein n=1 Tax=Sulfitobacter sp. TaxID=1903071 RepID=UPI000C0C58DE|nr:phosphoglycerate mutase [Roseobacter sp.]MBV49798.1 phosphoglycerate mutase [Roseobacter sp.]PHR09153.1 MAG: phosphoglycerate mutase [Sulfitobacter sp.]THF70094.1 MAG: histidine phosphatase family protein [Sulfitobacter sp. SK025]|tara:strand:- start:2546 stop:3127 length:582 start_codon:yes stop_codon:yes gene_type:complete